MFRLACVVVLGSLCCSTAAFCQERLTGRVLDSSDRTPVVGATITDLASSVSSLSDQRGYFAVRATSQPPLRLAVKALGFAAETLRVGRLGADTVEALLRRVPTSLAGVEVKSTSSKPLANVGFYEREQQGAGHFVDRARLQQIEGRPLHDAVDATPGLALWRFGNGVAMYSTRQVSRDKCAFCRNKLTDLLSAKDISAGARPQCYMDVYVDGTLVYQYGMDPPMDLFDLDALNPADVEGIEIYSSAAQMPMRFNRSSRGCGALVIWLRRSGES